MSGHDAGTPTRGRTVADGRSRAPLRIAMLGIRSIPTDPGPAYLPATGAPVPRGLMGGAELAVERLSIELARAGHDVTVYCRQGRRLIADPSYAGVRLITLPCLDSQHGEAISHTLIGALHASFASRARAGRPDLVHFHATGPALLSFLPRLFRIPTVVTVQGLDWKREKWGMVARQVLKAGARAAGTFPDATIVVSRFLERHYRSVYDSSACYIPNGVDLPAATAPGSLLRRLGLAARRYVLFLSRLVPEKGAHADRCL